MSEQKTAADHPIDVASHDLYPHWTHQMEDRREHQRKADGIYREVVRKSLDLPERGEDMDVQVDNSRRGLGLKEMLIGGLILAGVSVPPALIAWKAIESLSNAAADDKDTKTGIELLDMTDVDWSR